MLDDRYIRVSLKTKKKNIAEQKRLNLEKRLNSDDPFDRAQIKQILFKDYIASFLMDYAKVHYKPGNFQITNYRCQILIQYLGGKLLTKITVNDINCVLNKIEIDRELQNQTVNAFRMLFSKMFNFAIKTEYARHNPVKNVERFKVVDKTDSLEDLSKDEIKRILRACSRSFYPIAMTLVYTGIRKGELCGLKWDDVNFAEDIIIIKGSYNETTKSNKERNIPLHQELKKTLLEYRRNSNKNLYVFPSRLGKMHKGDFRGVIKRIFKNASIDKKPGVHIFRHTSGTQFLDNGGNIYALQKCMGHASIKTTERYLH